MSYDVTWLVENRAIYVRVWDDYTLDELAESAEMTRGLIQNGSPLVHDIIDFRAMKTYPTNLSEIITRASVFKEENIGWVVVISDSRMVKFLSAMATGIFKVRFRNFDDWREAMMFLKNIDTTLPDMTAIPDPLQTP